MWKRRSLQPFEKSLILKCKYLDLRVPLLGIIPQKTNRGTGKDFRPQIHTVQYELEKKWKKNIHSLEEWLNK